ncbi:MAG: hypothetical protein ACXAC5_02100 [Promethearchaeota archaeon]|jgi:hypothetical protein
MAKKVDKAVIERKKARKKAKTAAKDNCGFLTPTPAEVRILRELYQQHHTPLDRLPYTHSFDRLISEFSIQSKRVVASRDVWMMLLYLRKQGTLGRLKSRTVEQKGGHR